MSRATRFSRSFVRHLSSARQTATEGGWLEDVRGLQKQDRFEMHSVKVEADELLHRLEQFRKPLYPVVESVPASLAQKKYICTQRLQSAKDIISNTDVAVKYFNTVKDHINDLEQEPYPQWSPGDSDVILRQIQDPKTDRTKLEVEAEIRHKDAMAEIERLNHHITNAEAVAKTFKAKGAKAASAHAKQLTSKPEADHKPPPLPKTHEVNVVDIDDGINL